MKPEEVIERRYREIVSAWRQNKPETRDDLASRLLDYRVYFAYNSGRIENDAITYHDTREVFENGRAVSFTGDVRTLFEIQNQKECNELLLVVNGHPPIIIYDEDKLAYYGAMQVWDDEEDLVPMIAFLKAEAVKTWQ